MKLNQRFKITLRSLFLLIGVSLLGVFFWYLKPSPPSSHFAIIPHFMLASQKVDQFYEFLQTKRYMKNDPQTIVIIAPNHFNQRSQTPQTICKASEVYVKNQNYKLTPFPGVDCDEGIFYPFGGVITTKEHGIGEHLPRIAKYFPNVKEVMPLILPTHREPNELLLQGKGKVLRIASVDFSHYLPEATAQINDEVSVIMLQSGTGQWADFRSLDVDCPACLYSLDRMAKGIGQEAQLWRRDSSSSILGRDMEKENTSRVFMWYE